MDLFLVLKKRRHSDDEPRECSKALKMADLLAPVTALAVQMMISAGAGAGPRPLGCLAEGSTTILTEGLSSKL